MAGREEIIQRLMEADREWWKQTLLLVMHGSGVLLGAAVILPGLAGAAHVLVLVFVFGSLGRMAAVTAHPFVRALAAAFGVLFLFGRTQLLPEVTMFPALAASAAAVLGLIPGADSRTSSASASKSRAAPVAPGPAQRQGRVLTAAKYGTSMVLSMMNPLQLGQVFYQLAGMGAAWIRYRGRFPTPIAYRQSADFILPFQGTWVVAGGGFTEDKSHSWEILNQRYAYDFVMINDEGCSHRGEGTACDDYFCYGEPITAPAAGTVAAVRTDVRDSPYPGTMAVDFLAKDLRGNFVIIRHSESEYSLLAHFVPHSVEVKPGDTVAAGQRLGRCGCSGHATEPHLHFHVQDTPDFFTGVSLPIRFSEVFVDQQFQRQAILQEGQRVQSSAPDLGVPEGPQK